MHRHIHFIINSPTTLELKTPSASFSASAGPKCQTPIRLGRGGRPLASFLLRVVIKGNKNELPYIIYICIVREGEVPTCQQIQKKTKNNKLQIAHLLFLFAISGARIAFNKILFLFTAFYVQQCSGDRSEISAFLPHLCSEMLHEPLRWRAPRPNSPRRA